MKKAFFIHLIFSFLLSGCRGTIPSVENNRPYPKLQSVPKRPNEPDFVQTQREIEALATQFNDQSIELNQE